MSVCGTAAVVAGCYAYRPAEQAAAPLRPGEPVRLVLVHPAPVELRAFTVNGATRIDGELIRTDSARIDVSVWWVTTADGLEYKGVGETLELRWAQVDTLQTRALSAPRTSVLAAGFAALGVLFATRFGVGSAEGDTGPEPPVQK